MDEKGGDVSLFSGQAAMARPFKQDTVRNLRLLTERHSDDSIQLRRILEELEYRKNADARDLQREVEQRLAMLTAAQVPMKGTQEELPLEAEEPEVQEEGGAEPEAPEEEAADREKEPVPPPLEPAQPNGDPPDDSAVGIQGLVKEWSKRLIDLSRSNRLVSFLETKTNSFLLPEEMLDTFLERGTLEPADLEGLPLPKGEGARTAGQVLSVLRHLRRGAAADREELGLETLFVGAGFATWEPLDGGAPANAPVLLYSCDVVSSGGTARLERIGGAQLNPVLLHLLRKELHLSFDEDEVLEDPDDPDSARVFERLRDIASDVAGFKILGGGCVRRFHYQGLPMVQDMASQADVIAEHPIVQAITGDSVAQGAFGERTSPSEENLDEVPPDDEWLFLDADASQRRAIRGVRRGNSAVIHGPPGTGKSQTIANLMADLAANGKSVLFVAEKEAATNAVQNHLDHCDLGPMSLNLHSKGLRKRDVARRLRETIEWLDGAGSVDPSEAHAKFEEVRGRLVDHPRRIHAVRPETGESLYATWGALLRTPEEARTSFQFTRNNLERLKGNAWEEVQRLLAEAAEHPKLFLRSEEHPWSKAEFGDAHEAEDAREVLLELHAEFPELLASIDRARASLGARQPENLGDGLDLLGGLEAVADILPHYPSPPGSEETRNLLQVIDPASGAVFERWLALLTSREYRAGLRDLRQRRAEKARPDVLYEELCGFERAWEVIGRHDGEALPESAELDWKGVRRVRDRLQDLLKRIGRRADEIPWEGAQEWLRSVNLTSQEAAIVPKVRRVEANLREYDLGPFLKDLRESSCPANLWRERFLYAWRSSHLYRLEAHLPEEIGFHGRNHDEAVREFQRLEGELKELALERIRAAVAERGAEAEKSHPSQVTLIRREAGKRTKHRSIRKLFVEAGDALTHLVPCWVASPLTVSQYMDGTSERFDVVIFDEGSQVPPERAIPAIYRGRQLVVAGDPEQLPPGKFFAHESEEENGDDGIDSYESVLDLMRPFAPNYFLAWHYRSEDERLIAYSNHEIYRDRLITLPSANDEQRLWHEVVPKTYVGGPEQQSATAEVHRVVEQAIQHARERPDESLGIITLGSRHRNRVEGHLDQELEKEAPEIRSFFENRDHERVFVKNLERVQGEERDAILLTVGYGWESEAKLKHTFGPIAHERGYRRLNVAITRARKRMGLISSFRAEDIDLGRVRYRGVALLRGFLAYAEQGGYVLAEDPQAGDTRLNDFELDIKETLEDRGIPLLPQYGASGYKIDLAAMHPERPGLPVLAIECDGATYHSVPSARDRDRLRQRQLERLGWRFHRIWSTDWFYRRGDEIARALNAYERAVATFESSEPRSDLGDSRVIEMPTGVNAENGRDAQQNARRDGLSR